MTLHELFANHPWIAGCLVAFVAAELIVAGVLVARLFRKPKPRRGDTTLPQDKRSAASGNTNKQTAATM